MRRLRRDKFDVKNKFNAKIDKNTSISFYQKDLGIYCVVKKDLDYETSIFPSEAPILNEFLKSPKAFETTIADIEIFEKEILPITVSLSQIFGEEKRFSLDAVRLAVGSSENDFITIDETDLENLDVVPSLQGLLDFIKDNPEGIIGFCDRIFQHDQGNLIFFESKLRNPSKNIKIIKLSILSSLQQRGLYMQLKHQYYGLQLYVVIKCDTITDTFLEFLKALGIDWELLFLRRDLSLADWIELECELNSINLKGYIKNKYVALGFFDINNITRLVVLNQLSFKIANKIADMLNKSKIQRDQGFITGDKKEPLNKAEIAAAAQLSCAYYGEDSNALEFDKEVTLEDLNIFKEELVKL
ncbi:MAG: hypothetical protein ACTSWY_01895 [Promethearchaeota archaeon]